LVLLVSRVDKGYIFPVIKEQERRLQTLHTNYSHLPRDHRFWMFFGHPSQPPMVTLPCVLNLLVCGEGLELVTKTQLAQTLNFLITTFLLGSTSTTEQEEKRI